MLEDVTSWKHKINHARRMVMERGVDSLQPHVLLGNHCGCRQCFSCAAAHVFNEQFTDKELPL